MILFRYVIKQLHISFFKFQPVFGWRFITPSATALGSILSHTSYIDLPCRYDERIAGIAIKNLDGKIK